MPRSSRSCNRLIHWGLSVFACEREFLDPIQRPLPGMFCKSTLCFSKFLRKNGLPRLVPGSADRDPLTDCQLPEPDAAGSSLVTPPIVLDVSATCTPPTAGIAHRPRSEMP